VLVQVMTAYPLFLALSLYGQQAFFVDRVMESGLCNVFLIHIHIHLMVNI
jgi:hypothetical protein